MEVRGAEAGKQAPLPAQGEGRARPLLLSRVLVVAVTGFRTHTGNSGHCRRQARILAGT